MKLHTLTTRRVLALPVVLSAAATLSSGQGASPVQAPWRSTPTTFYPVGITPTAQVLADLDGDGLSDLAVVSSSNSPVLSVLRGDGVGGFEPASATPLSRSALAIGAADLDADGDTDLFLADQTFSPAADTVSVLLNRGDGSFAAPSAYPFGSPPAAVVAADIDGDGNLDLVAALLQAVGVVFGAGDGTFGPPSLFVLTDRPTDLAAGDLDGDGDPDLVLAMRTGDLVRMMNLGFGFGTPTPHASIPNGFFNDDSNLVLGDADGDGDLDVLLSSTSTGQGSGGIGYGAAAYFQNPGTGLFGAAQTVPLDPSAQGGVALALEDLTEDGVPDLVAVTGAASWVLVPGDGAGGFGAAQVHRTAGGPVDVVTGDLDGDARPDVVVLSGKGLDAAVHRNRGGGAFADAGWTDMIDPGVAPASSAKLLVRDLDLDGEPDLVVGYSENFNSVYGISVRRGLGGGAFAPAQLYAAPEFPEWTALGDLDGDLDPDLVWLDGGFAFSPRLRWRANLGDGTFGPAKVLPGSYCANDARIRIEDLNGDGRNEVIVYTCYDRVFVLRNTRDGGFTGPFTTTVSGGAGAMAFADFDEDGFPDLATNSAIQGYPEVRFGDGMGSFGAPLSLTTGRGVEALETGDVNGDGHQDLVAAYSLDGDGLSVVLGHGDGTFEPSVDYAGVYTGATDNLALGDLDGDGDLDAVIASHEAREVVLWRGNGDGSFAPGERLGTSWQPTSAAIADVTSDGLADLVALVEPFGAGGCYYPAVSVLAGQADPWADLGNGLGGTTGTPRLRGLGAPEPDARFRLELSGALPSSPAFFVGGRSAVYLPLRLGVLVPSPEVVLGLATDVDGGLATSFHWPATVPPGFQLFFQVWVADGGAPRGFSASNGLSLTGR